MIMMTEDKYFEKLVKSSPKNIYKMEASYVMNYLFVYIFIFSLLP